MAKYLDTSHISSELMELLKEAKERIILVTYSLQVNSHIQERLKTKSKIGTLAEITLIYGNTKPKQSELQWMSEIDDLKVWQKKNLHAKCYINEKKAIISSMNLYDYSQTTNVEMGFLITKEEDPEAFAKMMEDVEDLRINGERKKPWLENDTITEEKVAVVKQEEQSEPKSLLTYRQQIKKQLLEHFRSDMSSQFRQKAQSILSDQAILEIVNIDELAKIHLKQILKNDKKLKELGDEILYVLEQVDSFVIGKVIDTRYQNDQFSYDQIRMTRFDSDSTNWYDTKMELPKINQIVAVKLNNTWFNDYMILKDSEIQDIQKPSQLRNFSKSTFRSTKELSEITGLSSREINETLTMLKLMYKKENDWHATKKGENLGAIQKEGQFGKFIIWPEEIIKDIGL